MGSESVAARDFIGPIGRSATISSDPLEIETKKNR
jgi:hypothetical protein